MSRILASLVLILSIGCAPSDQPTRRELERLYEGLLLAAAPGDRTGAARPDELLALIDSLGGPERAESLLVESMADDPEGWRLFLDSLAKSLP